MARLNGLKFVPADMLTHWEALQDLPDAVLVGAVSHAQRSCVDFPTPFELRCFADLVRPHVDPIEPDEDRTRTLATPVSFVVPFLSKPIVVTKEWAPHCETCADTGWDVQFCGPADDPHHLLWVDLWKCERWGEHLPHEWARKCQCFDTNPAIQAKLERQRKYAAERTGKK